MMRSARDARLERVARVGLITLIAITACAPAPRVPAPDASVVGATPTASVAPTAAAPASVAPTPAGEARRRDDPRWIAARDPDPAEKARLALAVGAAGLLDALSDPGDTPDVALAALPYADDADLALAPLADRLRQDPARRRRLLVALLAIAGQPRGSREPLDPEGARRAGAMLLAIARDGTQPREDRVVAVSTLRALAERGQVDRATIPADLDLGTPAEP
jgi:hypothetical protein